MRKRLARFVAACSSAPRVSVGQHFQYTWRVRNDGDVAWPASVTMVQVGHENFEVTNVFTMPQGLAPGESGDITVGLRAPALPGRYAQFWRLALPSGIKIGQRLNIKLLIGAAQDA